MLCNKGKEQLLFDQLPFCIRPLMIFYLIDTSVVYRHNCSISLLIHFSIVFVHSLVYLFRYAPQTLFMILPFGHLILDSVEKCFK